MVHRSAVVAVVVAVAFGLATCNGSPVTSHPDELYLGTWGGDDVGLIVSDAGAHVHVGCTYGDFPAPIALDEELRFSVAGEYILQAFPVAVGPTLPAQLAGVVKGRDLTLTVAVNDTVAKALVVLGPATVRLGREPDMAQCPICADPDDAPRPTLLSLNNAMRADP